MPNGHLLELSSLVPRHPPTGAALLHIFAPAAIVRLAIDPTPQPPGTMTRRIEVNWLRRPGNTPATQAHRDLGWNGLQHYLGTLCVQLPLTVNDRTLTEQAAIAVLALLIHDLEGGVLQSVLPIGSGGDYLVRLRGDNSFLQVEVSGVKADADGSLSGPRLREKSQQVLTHRRVGYASVTTFAYRPEAVVHSYHHYVKRKKRGKK